MDLHTIEICAGVGMLGEGLQMKPIPGFDGLYSALEDGRIYSHITSRFLKPSPTGKNGMYRSVALGAGNTCNVHKLVLLTFRGPPPAGMGSRHMDGIGCNNALGNLQWATHSVNTLDKNSHGTMPKGEWHHACAISNADVAALIKKRADGLSYPQLGRMFGISKSQAHRIATNQNRKEASCG